MLRALILLSFLSLPPLQLLAECGEKSLACPVDSTFLTEIEDLSQSSKKKVDEFLKDESLENLLSFLPGTQNKDLHQETLLFSGENRAFLDKDDMRGTERRKRNVIYIFVSFSIGERAILNLAEEAKHYGATLVLRGFKDGSFRKTLAALSKIILKTGQGVLIDPELFRLFKITAVPTLVLSKPVGLQAAPENDVPPHDRLQGHVSLRHVLESFSKEGDLQDGANSLLKQGGSS